MGISGKLHRLARLFIWKRQLETNSTVLSHHHIVTVWNVWTSHIILTLFFLNASFPSFRWKHFVQSNLLFEILCKHSMHIDTVKLFIYLIYIYFSIEHRLSAVYGSTVTLTPVPQETKLDTKDNCTALNFSDLVFFLLMHNTFHGITFIQLLYVLNITLFTNWFKKSKPAWKLTYFLC